MGKYNVIGKSPIKKDVKDKVLGKSLFSSDMEVANMLHSAVKRSEIASAYLKSIDTSKAKSLPGVVAVLTAEDIPGEHKVGIIFKDEPVLVSDKIRRIGDAIAIVAAETREIALEACKLIEIEYEEIEPIFSIEDAMKEESHKIHNNSNLLQKSNLVHGDVEEAFKNCDVIIENIYKTNYAAHMYIETEAGIAVYENGIMKFWGSTQNPHYDRTEVARVLNLPQNKVRSIQATTGAGFGGKLDISVQCHTALLAYYTNRPVKMIRTREESMVVSSKRHPMTMHYKTGAMKSGKIIAMQAHMTGDTGAYASYGPAVISRAVVHGTGPYEIPNVKITAEFYYTNNPMAGAMRGFGVPQASIAHEGQMDALANELGISNFEIRAINALKVGSTTATGQVLEDSVGIGETVRAALKKAQEVISVDIEGGSKE